MGHVGIGDGAIDGIEEAESVGTTVGNRLGTELGMLLGAILGIELRINVGTLVLIKGLGIEVWSTDGAEEGLSLSIFDNSLVGDDDGAVQPGKKMNPSKFENVKTVKTSSMSVTEGSSMI